MSNEWLKPYQRTAAGADLIALKRNLESIVTILLDSTHDLESMFNANNEAVNGLTSLLRVAMKDEEIERIEREQCEGNDDR